MRIVSLLPAATEMLFALGLDDDVVAVSHECDYPPGARQHPRITRSAIDSAGLSSGEIDRAIAARVAGRLPIYEIDTRLLAALQPDLIVTQGLCDVCALPAQTLAAALTELAPRPATLSLDAGTLDGVLDSISELGRATGATARAQVLVGQLRARIEQASRAVRGAVRRRVVCLEWLDPPYACGHWVPEMVALAAACDLLGRAGVPSAPVTWSAVGRAAPEVIVAMPCGYNLARAREELAGLAARPEWRAAARHATIYAAAGGAYFSRPGPRLVEGIEVLAAAFHPDRIAWPLPADALARVDLS